MAQSTIELPDPLEGSAGYAGADDLLAQLAGEEVDRLLSDAEAGATRGPAVSLDEEGAAVADELDEARQTRERVAEVAGEELTATALDELFTQMNEGTPEAGLERRDSEVEGGIQDRRGVPAGEAGEVVAASVAEVMGAVDPDWEAFQKEVKTSDGGEGGVAAAKLAEPASVADALALEMEEDERINRVGNARAAGGIETEESEVAALAEMGGAVAAEEAPAVVIDEELAEPMEGEVVEAEEGSTPILVRVLEWINSPLSGFSEGVREMLGKVAIVTMLNATAVLVYVLVFRKHP